MVIVLAVGPGVRGFRRGRERWIFEGDKNRSAPSFGGEVKPSVPCFKISRRVKDPLKYARDGKIHWPFLSQFLPASLLGFCCNQNREMWWMNRE
jgi:hypothetical protein